jgi:Xaa-Pro dipeptidase
MPEPFRQRRYFYYLSGADFEDCIVTYDIGKDDLRLFIPPVDPTEVIWLGPTPSIKECEEKYDVDCVDVTSNTNKYLMGWLQRSKKPTIYILHETQSPRLMTFGPHGLEILKFKKILNWTFLLPAMDAARVIKSEYEVAMIRRANEISSYAHTGVLQELAVMSNETHIEAMFEACSLWKGAKKQAYGIIAGSGENASTLHYVANNQPLEGRQLVCMDAGCEWECYASDVTRTFPISGTFTKEAQEIYNIVEDMQETCIKMVKPGVIYRDLHLLAMEIAVKGLMKLGVLHNGTLEEILPTGRAFFPHGVSDPSRLNSGLHD